MGNLPKNNWFLQHICSNFQLIVPNDYQQRERALILDEKMRRERNAHWVRNIEGVRTVRKGAIKTA